MRALLALPWRRFPSCTRKPACRPAPPPCGRRARDWPGATWNNPSPTASSEPPRRALEDGLPVLQHSAAVRPGNSGGPLLTDRGGLAGLNALRSWFDDTGFALPASRIRELLQPAKANP